MKFSTDWLPANKLIDWLSQINHYYTNNAFRKAYYYQTMQVLYGVMKQLPMLKWKALI